MNDFFKEEFVTSAYDFSTDLLTAAVILILGWIIAKTVARYTDKALHKSKRLDKTIIPMVVSIVRYTILTFVIIAVLAQFGVETTSVIAVLGAAGLAIGLALQGTLQNIAAGFMLLFLRPMKSGEMIDADGVTGTVNEIGLFVTQMTTVDGLYLCVPNSRLWSSVVTNFSRNDKRRTDLVVGIGYQDDIGKAQKAILKALTKDERIIKDPEPVILNAALGASSVDLNIRYWTATGDYFPTLSDTTRRVKEALDKAGISIPYPQQDVHIVSDIKNPKAAE